MDANIPITPLVSSITDEDIRQMILESWAVGEVADSMLGQNTDSWVSVAKQLSEELGVHLETPYEDHTTGKVYLRANHGFPVEMDWQSIQAREWLRAVPERQVQRNMWNDLFLERGGLA